MGRHTEESCWRKHPEKSPASLAKMSVVNTSSKIIAEIETFFRRMRRRYPQ
jgi:hypothetical protein